MPSATDPKVVAIQLRYAAGESPGKLAEEFGITRQMIHRHTVGKGVARQKPAPRCAKLTVHLSEEEATALREYARERGVPVSEAIALAVRGLLALRRR